MRRLAFLVVGLWVGLGWSSGAGANLIVNGSFENPASGTHWTGPGIVAGNPFSFNPNFATDGSYLVGLGGGGNPQPPPTVYSQGFSTAAGQEYQLEFDYGAYGLAVTQYMQVSVVGQSSLLDVVVSHTPQTYPGASWQTEVFLFTADSSLSTLTFTDAGDPWVGHSTDGLLDRVSIVPIPEPSTALLLGLGLAGMAARRRV